VGNALTELAAGITRAQKLLTEAHEMAATVPAKISADGTVTADPPPDARKSDGWMANIATGTKAVADKIAEALKAANEADGRASGKLASVVTPDAANLSDADLAAKLPGKDVDTPAEVAAWWKSLTPAEREALKNEYPGKIGDLDGVPAKDRDDANRLKLDNRQQEITDRARQIYDKLHDPATTPEERAKLLREQQDLGKEWDRLDKLEKKLAEVDAKPGPDTLLLKYDTNDDGKAIVSVGDPDKADNTVTYVPGTKSTIDNFGEDLDRSYKTWEDAAKADPDKSTASITWLDYDAPDNPVKDAPFDNYYKAGAKDLAEFQRGLAETHDAKPSNTTVLGHSYGGSTVGYAADKYDLKADNIVHVASPGSGQEDRDERADGYQGRPKVYATNGEGDVVGNIDIHGRSTVAPDYGAKVFDSGDSEHTTYWDNPAFRDNVGKIVTGQGDRVTPQTREPVPNPYYHPY
ncbi:MAG TPA: alpha/beta hydrolase, partial [Phytomonospora sp.]